MAEKKREKKTTGRPLGVAGEAVRKNIRSIRDTQGISGTELSARMTGLKRPIPPLGIQRIEAGSRRVDVDDLVAFAVALGVSPITLLMPEAESAEDRVSVGGVNMSARMLWDWLRADRTPPALAGAQLEFITRALPAWELERIEREYAEMRRETQRAAAEASMALERIKMDSAEDSDGDD